MILHMIGFVSRRHLEPQFQVFLLPNDPTGGLQWDTCLMHGSLIVINRAVRMSQVLQCLFLYN